MADADAVLLPLALRRRGVGGLPSHSTARAHGGVTFSLEPLSEEEPCHMLDACFLCRRPFGAASDVFMYMGDTAFCSKECRQEQIDMDEARERESRYRRRRHHHHLSVSVKQAPSSPQQSVYVPASDGVVAS